jgi:hypothetical protein
MPSFPGCRTCADNNIYDQPFGDIDNDTSVFDAGFSVVRSDFGNYLLPDFEVIAGPPNIDCFYG